MTRTETCQHQFEIVASITIGHGGHPQYVHKCKLCDTRVYAISRRIGEVVSPYKLPDITLDEEGVPWK